VNSDVVIIEVLANMKFIFYVILPMCLQLLIGTAVMFSHKPGAEFVGLGVMLIGAIAIPTTFIINLTRIRSNPPISSLALISRTFYTTLVFPVLCTALYIFAS
jgi:hypothetical protein